jgi:hypothetical protein
VAKKPVPPTPEALATRRALQRLVATPEWAEYVKYSARYIINVPTDPTSPNVSALLLVEGRRSFHRELIERLEARVSDEPRPGTGTSD